MITSLSEFGHNKITLLLLGNFGKLWVGSVEHSVPKKRTNQQTEVPIAIPPPKSLYVLGQAILGGTTNFGGGAHTHQLAHG